jgi:AcrR family transcriptional regulator
VSQKPEPPSSWTQRKPRESAEVTIEAMLEAGREILQERFRDKRAGGVLGLIKASDVAQRSGKTTGAFFYWWPTQEAYRRQLLDYMVARQRALDIEQTLAAIQDVTEARGHTEVSDTIRAAIVSVFEGLRDSSMLEVCMAVWATRGEEDTELLRRYYSQINDGVLALFEVARRMEGRRMRAPYELQDLATAMTSLVHALYIRWTLDPAALRESVAPPGVPPPPEGHPARWNLASSLCHLIFEAMSEPIPPRED